MSLFPRVAVSAAALIAALPALAGEPEGKVQATLEMSVRKLDFEGSKKLGMMYMPSSAKLDAARPAQVKKEPKYAGTPKYGVVNLGNGAVHEFAMALDEPEKGDPKIYLDLNGNGDLTDDNDGSWMKKDEHEGSAPQYSGTWPFKVSWRNSDGTSSTGEYALNFYRSPDRETVNYYRASARTGKITVGGKDYELTLVENDNDGLFNKLYDPASPVPAEKLPKPVWLSVDGDRQDIRGTFGWGDYNYIAHVSDDGSKLTMEPTARLVRLPRPAERPEMLGAGGPVPDFEGAWLAAAAESGGEAKPETFKISGYKGKKIVVLDLWASWCGPCKAGLPHISKIAEAVKGQDVEVIALNVWDDAKAYERYAREECAKYKFRVARDPAGRDKETSVASRLFKLSGIPATYVIDKDGKIYEAVSGYTEGDKRIEHALVRLGVKIEGIKPEEAAKEKPAAKMPAMGLK